MPNPDSVDAELRALLQRLKAAGGRTYEQLATEAHMSHGTAQNYLTRAGWRRDTRMLELLLTALRASDQDRARALELHRQMQPGGVDPAEEDWLARARRAGCTVWPMAEFAAAEATVHTAIGRRHAHQRHPDDRAAPPAYVERAHDAALRRDIAAAARGELRALIVLRGSSSTGKTRSLFEAIRALGAGWTVLRPHSATALAALPGSGLLDRPSVVWLNELQGFLGPSGHGMSVPLLRDLYQRALAPVVLVSTVWPDKLRRATDPHDERTSTTRELLNGEWVRRHEIPRTLTTEAERAALRRLAVTDSRLADAFANRDGFGFAQTLAGARELLECYHSAPEPAQLLFNAAADARRLGHAHALTAPLLRALTLALWREDHGRTRPPSGWFTDALTYAAEALRGNVAVRALIPLDDEIADDITCTGEKDVEPSGYALADFLEQHLTRTRRLCPVPDRVWAACTAHAGHPDDLTALARDAADRGRHHHTEALYRAAAAAGAPGALLELAGWLSGVPGRETDAETAFRESAAAGVPGALLQLARWLRRVSGREAAAETAFRESAVAGDPYALRELADWLSRQQGREADAEAAYREAAVAGDPYALREPATWSGWPRRAVDAPADAEAAYREAAAANPYLLLELADWLSRQQGREADAEAAYREAAAAGDPTALLVLADWLFGLPGREADVEATYREAAAAGIPGALRLLAEWLRGLAGREADVEAAYREASAADDPRAPRLLAAWLRRVPGREADAEAAYRQAAAAGDPHALRDLADWLRRVPGREADAEAAYREAADAGDPYAPGALRLLADWLFGVPGREADAEAIYREAAAAGEPGALRDLAGRLRELAGREAEADRLERHGLDATGRTAMGGRR